MSDLVSLYCPNCGKKLQFPSSLENFFCTYCGTKLQHQNGGLIKVPDNQYEETAKSAIPSQQTGEISTGKQQKPRSKSSGCLKRGLFAMCLLVAMAALGLMMPGIPKDLATAASIIEGLAVAGLVVIPLFGKGLRLAVVSIGLTALSFYAVPVYQIRAVLVITFSLVSLFAIATSIVTIVRRFSQHRRARGLMIGLAAILILELVTGSALNNYADSRVAPSAALIQDYYTRVVVAVEQGNQLAAGYLPTGVTYAKIMKEAQTVEEGLSTLDVPGNLVDYKSKVQAWADSISWTAAGAADGGKKMWNPSSINSFELEATTDQVYNFVTTSKQQVANLLEFADYSNSTNNTQGLLWAAARLKAQSYWLTGISKSTDPSWIDAHLHFIEPVVFPTTSDTTSSSTSSIKMIEYRLVGNPDNTGCISSNEQDCRNFAGELVGPVDTDISTIHGVALRGVRCGEGSCAGTRYEEVPSSTWPPDATPKLLGSDVQWIQETPSSESIPNFSSPPESFKQYCDSQGKEITERNEFGASPDTSRAATSEDGWVCHKTNDPCWTLLSLSGANYAGGDGCPEEGLIPPPGGPIGELVAFTGSVFHIGPPINVQPMGPEIISWDGTYTVTKSTFSCPGWAGTSGINSAVGSTDTVINNIIDGIPIDPNTGQAVYSISEEGISVREVFSFVHDAGGGAHVTVTLDVSGNAYGISMHCSGSMTAVKNP